MENRFSTLSQSLSVQLFLTICYLTEEYARDYNNIVLNDFARLDTVSYIYKKHGHFRNVCFTSST